MRAIIVDDEPTMLKRFVRLSEGIQELNLVGDFRSPERALEFAYSNPFEIAFLDVEMPTITGIELAEKLREIRHDILIVFVTAYEDYVRDFNRIGGDYYIVKPYEKETIEMAMERLRLIAHRQKKKLYLHMFGSFTVTYDGVPIPLKGKAKEILAYVAAYRGNEVSNQTIYTALWENKPYDNREMTVYFHALKKLKDELEKYNVRDLLISSARGQMINVEMVDCDFYSWQDNNSGIYEQFRGEFLTEYSWSEPMLADMLLLSL